MLKRFKNWWNREWSHYKFHEDITSDDERHKKLDYICLNPMMVYNDLDVK